MSRLSRPIITDPVVIVQNACAIVGDNPIYALVELITNSDDSYSRMEQVGLKPSGLIHIELIRRWKDSIFRVTDQAEGFDREQMDKKIARYGGKTGGREEVATRGYFMRGLKEAIIGMGYGKVGSIKNGYFYECEVDENAYYTGNEPQKATSQLKGKLGVAETGTVVELKATRNSIKTPRFETLKEQLQKYFSLRKILQDPNRIVQLVERNGRGGKKRKPVRISYKSPEGEKIHEGKIYINYEGRKIEADIKLWRSEVPLSNKDEAGPYRENGLLISDGKAIHDITLFKYDNAPDAENFFGELQCGYIYKLMNEKEQVISAKRDQLNPRHPFVKALKEATEKALAPIVKEERKRREKEKRDVETKETQKRFKELLKDLDNISKDELGDEGTTGTEEDEDKKPEIPENGFAFIPPVTTVVSGRCKTITLRALVPYTIPFGEEVTVESDSEEVIIHTPTAAFGKLDVVADIASRSIKIEGRQAGAMAIITAKFGELVAECLVQVRSKPKEREGGGGPQRKKGIFKKIVYDSDADPRYRAGYDRTTGVITIVTKAPSVRRHLGPHGENQNERHGRVLVAELVTDVVCRELAKKKVEIGRATYPSANVQEAMNFERAQLINKYADRIHKILAG